MARANPERLVGDEVPVLAQGQPEHVQEEGVLLGGSVCLDDRADRSASSRIPATAGAHGRGRRLADGYQPGKDGPAVRQA
jgi:hypothetical protein